MIKRISVFIFAITFSLGLFVVRNGQSQTLTWKNLSSMYNVNGLAVIQGKVWASTSGGVFSYSPQNGTFNEFTTTEGLSNIQATSIVAESGNAILIGEQNGAIDELDASSGKPIRSQHDIANSAPLSKQVTNLSISGDTLFTCTPFGVVLVSLSTFGILNSYLHFVPSQSSVPANGVAVFNGNIYVASGYGLSIAPQSGANLSAPDLWQVNNGPGFSSGVNSLAVFNGMLLAGTGNGLYYSHDGTTFQQSAGLGNASVKSLSVGINSLLINSQNGLFKLDLNNLLTTAYNGGVSLNEAATYSDSLIFVATANGLLSIGATTRQILPPGPATNTVNDLSVDQSGNLWCATSSNDVGVAFMNMNHDDGTWRNYSVAQDTILPCNNFFKISAVCGNRVVGGTWGGPIVKNGYQGGMALVSNDSIIKIFNGSNSPLVGVPENPLYILVGGAACDASGNIWVVNSYAYNGNILAEYSPQNSTWQTVNDSYSPPAKFISIAIDAYGVVWTGDEYGDAQGTFHGLFYYNPANKEGAPLTMNDGLLSNQINALRLDGENQLWVGTSAGLDVLYDPSNPYISSIYSMLSQDVTGIDYDALNDIWVSTATGVYVLSTDGNTRLFQYDMTNSPLPSNSVNSVACDRIHGVVYFATPYGITQLKMGAVQPQDNFSKLKIFPNPAKLPLTQKIQIVGLVASSSIKIFSISGRLVKDFQAQGGDVAYWDGTDDSGKLVPSGVYIILAYSSDGSQSVVGKIAVIRE
ncbi:MAG: two-component regulator propeller domain-containing protein [Candidatus Kryptoniota bacterium]